MLTSKQILHHFLSPDPPSVQKTDSSLFPAPQAAPLNSQMNMQQNPPYHLRLISRANSSNHSSSATSSITTARPTNSTIANRSTPKHRLLKKLKSLSPQSSSSRLSSTSTMISTPIVVQPHQTKKQVMQPPQTHSNFSSPPSQPRVEVHSIEYLLQSGNPTEATALFVELMMEYSNEKDPKPIEPPRLNQIRLLLNTANKITAHLVSSHSGPCSNPLDQICAFTQSLFHIIESSTATTQIPPQESLSLQLLKVTFFSNLGVYSLTTHQYLSSYEYFNLALYYNSLIPSSTPSTIMQRCIIQNNISIILAMLGDLKQANNILQLSVASCELIVFEQIKQHNPSKLRENPKFLSMLSVLIHGYIYCHAISKNSPLDESIQSNHFLKNASALSKKLLGKNHSLTTKISQIEAKENENDGENNNIHSFDLYFPYKINSVRLHQDRLLFSSKQKHQQLLSTQQQTTSKVNQLSSQKISQTQSQESNLSQVSSLNPQKNSEQIPTTNSEFKSLESELSILKQKILHLTLEVAALKRDNEPNPLPETSEIHSKNRSESPPINSKLPLAKEIDQRPLESHLLHKQLTDLNIKEVQQKEFAQIAKHKIPNQSNSELLCKQDKKEQNSQNNRPSISVISADLFRTPVFP